MLPDPQVMTQEWTENEVMVHHAIIDFFEWYPFERVAGIDINIIEDCTGLSCDEVYEAVNGLTRKGVLSIDNWVIYEVKNEGYYPPSICLEQEWQVVLSRVKGLHERGRILQSQPTMRVHVRGRVGWWSAAGVQRALGTVEKYHQLKFALREHLMYAQALLWQAAAAVEALERVPQMGTPEVLD